MDAKECLNQIVEWQMRGWIVRLVSVFDGWALAIETPNSFEMNTPNERARAIGLRFNTAVHETPQLAICAAAEVLR